MNRLQLRIYQPPEDESQDAQASETPAADTDEHPEAAERHILPFSQQPPRTTIISGRMTAPVDRARLLNENHECPECNRSNIEPLELQDAIISPRSRLPIPGTATIVGFHCNECGTEWPVYELNAKANT